MMWKKFISGGSIPAKRDNGNKVEGTTLTITKAPENGELDKESESGAVIRPKPSRKITQDSVNALETIRSILSRVMFSEEKPAEPSPTKQEPATPQEPAPQTEQTEQKIQTNQKDQTKQERSSGMAQTISERLEQVLKNLEVVSPEIEGTAIASGDGLVIASNLPPGVDEDRVGAMSAAISALGERSAAELNRGEVLQVYVKGSKGYVVLTNIGTEAVLIAMTSERVKLGLLFFELRRAVDEIKNII